MLKVLMKLLFRPRIVLIKASGSVAKHCRIYDCSLSFPPLSNPDVSTLFSLWAGFSEGLFILLSPWGNKLVLTPQPLLVNLLPRLHVVTTAYLSPYEFQFFRGPHVIPR